MQILYTCMRNLYIWLMSENVIFTFTTMNMKHVDIKQF